MCLGLTLGCKGYGLMRLAGHTEALAGQLMSLRLSNIPPCSRLRRLGGRLSRTQRWHMQLLRTQLLCTELLHIQTHTHTHTRKHITLPHTTLSHTIFHTHTHTHTRTYNLVTHNLYTQPKTLSRTSFTQNIITHTHTHNSSHTTF